MLLKSFLKKNPIPNKLVEADGEYEHKILVYPIVTVTYDDRIQMQYEFPNHSKEIKVPACLPPSEAILGPKLVNPHMEKVKFDKMGPLRDKAFEKFKSEKFFLKPESLDKNKIKLI